MDDHPDILRFPKRPHGSPPHTCQSDDYDDPYDDGESWEAHVQFKEEQDYPGLVKYCESEVARHPADLYAQLRLGEAYVLNGQYQKAIDSMAKLHRLHPDIDGFQHIILDALYALGKTESDFPWVTPPTIIRLDTPVLDSCYEYLKPKRKPRTVDELHTRQLMQGYVMFSHEELMQALASDDRFTVNTEKGSYSAEVMLNRKTRRRHKC